jgi:hypothetical protein
MSYEEEDTYLRAAGDAYAARQQCMEEDTCMSYEEEDTYLRAAGDAYAARAEAPPGTPASDGRVRLPVRLFARASPSS